MKDSHSTVHKVLYRLPLRLSESLDKREDVPRDGDRQESVDIDFQGKVYKNVRTYVVVNILSEIAPNDWYFNVVLRGATTCKLPEEYCWGLFNHMHGLQSSQSINYQ